MIDLLPSDEQGQIIESVRGFLGRSLPVERLRSGSGAQVQISSELWHEIASLGWFGLGLPEERGGVGYTVIEEMLLARELGRSVASPALAATMLAVHIADLAGDMVLVERMMAGELRVGLANPLERSAPPAGGEFHLIEADQAELILRYDEKGAALYERCSFENIEAVVSFDDVVVLERATLGAASPRAKVLGPQIALHGTILNSAQLVGVAESARDMAVQYAKTREQFGQPIGGFQAIKHRCADMAVQAEAAYALTCFAGLAYSTQQSDMRYQVAAARRLAVSAALEAARSNIQIHGGMGFTSECDAHLYLKRAHLLSELSAPADAGRTVLLSESPVYG